MRWINRLHGDAHVKLPICAQFCARSPFRELTN